MGEFNFALITNVEFSTSLSIDNAIMTGVRKGGGREFER